MDPITLIITALVAGASKVGGEAAMDAYRALMTRIRRRFAKNEMAQKVLDEHANAAAGGEPGVWETPLRKYLTDMGAADDSSLITAAKAILEAAHQGSGTQVIGSTVNLGLGASLVAGGGVANTEVTISGRES
jgi:hypothetical protein